MRKIITKFDIGDFVYPISYTGRLEKKNAGTVYKISCDIRSPDHVDSPESIWYKIDSGEYRTWHAEEDVFTTQKEAQSECNDRIEYRERLKKELQNKKE